MSLLLELGQALFQVSSGAVDFSGGFGGGGEDGDSARHGVHEDGRVAGVVDLFERTDDGREVEFAAAGHLEEFLFLGQFFVATHAVLPRVKHDHAVAKRPDQLGQVGGALAKRFKMVGGQRDADVF